MLVNCLLQTASRSSHSKRSYNHS